MGGKCIVLAWTEKEQAIAPGTPVRYGYPVKRVTVDVPKAMVWMNNGGSSDIAKAKAYAAQAGYRVFTFPADEPDPLSRARSKVKHRRRRR